MGIIQAEKKAKKVSMGVSDEVFNLYTENKKTAKELGLKLDFDDEFSKWFKKINEKVGADLASRKQGK